MPVRRTKSIENTLLSRLEQGELITAICRDGKMPSIDQVQSWRRKDADFDDRCWSAEGRGLMVQRAELIEMMKREINKAGRNSSTKIQGLHNLLHDNARVAGKLVSRMNDRAELRVSGKVDHSHIILGWEEAPISPCPSCGFEPPILDRRAPNIDLVSEAQREQ